MGEERDLHRAADDAVIFEKGSPGRRASTLPRCDVPERGLDELLPRGTLREGPIGLPEVGEGELMRHYVALSLKNHHVDRDFYPLGSCTMKYNPKINEEMARLPGLADLHPMQPASLSQGALALMHALAEALKTITGFDAVTLQPSAGAQGEFTGIQIVRAWHRSRGNPRRRVIIPDSGHGTNPASVARCGYEAVTLASNDRGMIDLDALRAVLDEEVAALMLTVPNTLGKFEPDISEIARMAHDAGALMYLDGANLNAFMGIVRPADMGFDAMHINLHKTFSTPHGGGGPGAGPVAVVDRLAEFLPVPRVERAADGTFFLDESADRSIGRMHGFFGNFLVMVRALTYIRMQGASGIRAVSENAIINANYVMRRLEKHFDNPYPGICMHECVLSGERQLARGVKTLDIAKRLLDFGFHAPTVYFPLIVHEALMIEPTETESRESLDRFIEAMIRIAEEAERDPHLLTDAPHETPVRRLDEARAARELLLKWAGGDGPAPAG